MQFSVIPILIDSGYDAGSCDDGFVQVNKKSVKSCDKYLFELSTENPFECLESSIASEHISESHVVVMGSDCSVDSFDDTNLKAPNKIVESSYDSKSLIHVIDNSDYTNSERHGVVRHGADNVREGFSLINSANANQLKLMSDNNEGIIDFNSDVNCKDKWMVVLDDKLLLASDLIELEGVEIMTKLTSGDLEVLLQRETTDHFHNSPTDPNEENLATSIVKFTDMSEDISVHVDTVLNRKLIYMLQV